MILYDKYSSSSSSVLGAVLGAVLGEQFKKWKNAWSSWWRITHMGYIIIDDPDDEHEDSCTNPELHPNQHLM